MLLWSQFYASHGRDSPTLGHDSELKRSRIVLRGAYMRRPTSPASRKSNQQGAKMKVWCHFLPYSNQIQPYASCRRTVDIFQYY